MNWPSIVWCFITSNSLSVSAAGLFRMSLGIADLADVVQHRCELQLLTIVARDTEFVGHRVHQVHDGPRVLRRVLSSDSMTSESSITVPR